jgi:hypothetical protein
MLAELFDGRPELIVYHFMFGPNEPEGCPGCTFAADHFGGAVYYLAQAGVTFLCASRARLDDILAYRARQGWTFPWVSSAGSDFNRDYGAFTEKNARPGRASTSVRRSTRTSSTCARPSSWRSPASPYVTGSCTTPTRPTTAARTRSIRPGSCWIAHRPAASCPTAGRCGACRSGDGKVRSHHGRDTQRSLLATTVPLPGVMSSASQCVRDVGGAGRGSCPGRDMWSVSSTLRE